MKITSWQRLAAAAALAALPLAGNAAIPGITDPAGDFLPTFAGLASDADLDVVSATVLYDAGRDLFRLTATMAGAIGNDASHFYVWGVNRGAGVVSPDFASHGIDGVRFDRVVLVRSDGTGVVTGSGGGALTAGAVTKSGHTISAVVPGALLASTGFGKIDYTWNLWPRDGAYTGFAAISDFAPDNASFSSTAGVVPEPASVAMLLAGLGAVGFITSRRGRN